MSSLDFSFLEDLKLGKGDENEQPMGGIYVKAVRERLEGDYDWSEEVIPEWLLSKNAYASWCRQKNADVTTKNR